MMICWNRSPLPPLALCWGKSSLGGKPFLSRIVLWQRPPLIQACMLKHGKVVDIDHLDVPLAHAHVSVLQTTARQHCFRLTGELVSCFSMFEGKGEPGANCLSHYGARQEADGADPHRHLGPLPGISRGIVVEVVSCFSMFEGKGEPAANCPSHYGARQEADGADPHRHLGPLPGISRGIVVRRYARGQRLPPPAPVRHPRQECGLLKSRRRKAFHC